MNPQPPRLDDAPGTPLSANSHGSALNAPAPEGRRPPTTSAPPPPRPSRPTKPSNSHAWLWGVLLVAFAAAVLGLLGYWKYSGIKQAMSAPPPPEMPESVTIATSVARDYRPSVTAIGTVVAPRWVMLKNEAAGTIRSITLQSGGTVEEGQTLVQLDVSVEEAELASAKARLRLADQLLQRQIQALEANASSQSELDRARAERDQASAEAQRIEAIINRKSIKAPFKARTGMVNRHTGQYLAEGDEIAMLQALDGFAFIDFALTQANAEGVSIGQSVSATLGDGRVLQAPIIAADTQADPITRNLTFRAKLEDPSNALRPGASVRLNVERGKTLQLVGVPTGSVRRGPEGEMVFVAKPDDKGALRAHSVPIRSGPTIGDVVLLLGGLPAGERVIVLGSFKLREGAMVMDTAAAPPPPGPAQSAPGAPGATAAGAESSTKPASKPASKQDK